eukprot:CAMPEP_0178467958 /NCGR_PEP_ID=MMETSP0689_2-20121128/52676_1 /TAXON_ID=160604 /ORGANISM="Amphidinium massartii, Strain CS-259" /LENGTH=1332 /DNA_ID=CAMNT_0020095007 /DNA_START=41 /DNA_END=4036 /DNA_ORIENTATION=+
MSATAKPKASLPGRLKELNYLQPFSEESSPLVEQLLNDILRSAQTFSSLQQASEKRHQGVEETREELLLLQREHPRLLKENIELRQRLLSDRLEHARRRAKRACQRKEAEGRLAHAQALQQQEAVHLHELQQNVEKLQHRYGEMDRATTGSHTHRPSIVVQGPLLPLPAPKSGAQGLPHRQLYTLQFQQEAGRLAAERAKHGALVQELEEEKEHAQMVEAEVVRLRCQGSGPDGDRAIKELQAAMAELRSEQSQLESQESYLKRTCEDLRHQCEALRKDISSSKEEAAATRQKSRELEVAMTSVKQVHVTEEQAVDDSMSRAHDAWMSSTLKLREASTELATLAAERQRLAGELQVVQGRALQKEREAAGRLEAVRQELEVERRGRPAEEMHSFEEELQALTSKQAKHKAGIADLQSQISALHAHKMAQQMSIETRLEEIGASQMEHTASKEEVTKLEARVDAEELHVVSLRSENSELQTCSEETAAQRSELEATLRTLKQEVASLEALASKKQASERKASTEVEQARLSMLSMQKQITVLSEEEMQAQSESEALRQSMRSSQEELSTVQRKHRELSMRMDASVAHLLKLRQAQDEEKIAEEKCKAEIKTATEALRKHEASQEQHTADIKAEALRLEEASAAVKADARRYQTEEQQLAQELQECTSAMHPRTVAVREDLAHLAEEHARLRASSLEAAEESSAAQRAGTLPLQRAESELAAAHHEVSEQEEHLQNLQQEIDEVASTQVQASRLLRSRVEERIASASALLTVEETEESTLRSRIAEEVSEADAMSSSIASYKWRLEDLEAAEQSAQAGMSELEEQQAQLIQLTASLDGKQQQLQRQLVNTEQALAEEEHRVKQASSDPAQRHVLLEQIAAEDTQLRHTMAGLAASIKDMEPLVAAQQEELEGLRTEISACHSTRADFQWQMDRLKQASDKQQGELMARLQELEATSREVPSLEAQEQKLIALTEERRHEEALGVEDLLHMVRENQLLNEELLQLQGQEEALRTAATEQSDLGPSHVQAVKGTELQLEQVIESYRMALDDYRRGEVAVAELTAEGKRLEDEVETTQRSLAEVAHQEKLLQAHMTHDKEEISAMKARLNGATRELDAQEMACSQVTVRRVQLQSLVGYERAAESQAALKEVKKEPELDRLRREAEVLEEKLAESQHSSSQGHQCYGEMLTEQRRLQDRIAQHRIAQQRAQVENADLRYQLQERYKRSGDLALRSKAASEPSSAAAAAGAMMQIAMPDKAEELQKTVARQKALIEELTATEFSTACKVPSLPTDSPALPQATSSSMQTPVSSLQQMTPPRSCALAASEGRSSPAFPE